MWARAPTEEVTVTDRPRQTEVIEVLEYQDGRPSLVARHDCATNQKWIEKWEDGYRPKSGVEHAYDPIARGLGEEGND